MTEQEAQRAPRLLDHIVVRLVVYYTAVVGTVAILFYFFPEIDRLLSIERARQIQDASLDPAGAVGAAQGTAFPRMETLIPVALSMLGALALSVPIAWVYLWTRPSKGNRAASAQTIILLPIAVALAVFLVKGSLALAFGLAGIVAAVRWRTSLSETTDAAFMFIVIGIGLAAGVQLLVVALIASLFFNAVALTVWRTGFALRPVTVDGWYVRRGVAQGPAKDDRHASGSEMSIRIYAATIDGAVEKTEPILARHAKKWQITQVVPGTDGLAVVELKVWLKKQIDPAMLLHDLEALGDPQIRKVAVVKPGRSDEVWETMPPS